MKNLYKRLLAIFAFSLILAGCEKDKPKVNKDEDSVVIKTDEQIDDENLNDAYEDLVKEANKDLDDEEITFLASLLKYIDSGDVENLAKILDEPIKSEVGGDLRVLCQKLSPLNYSGPLEKIEKISKNSDKFTIICSCENDKLVIEANKKDKNLTNLKLSLASTMLKMKELKEDNQSFVDRSYQIINSLREGKKEEFLKDVKALKLSDEKFNEMYDGLSGDLKLMGNILEDEAKVEVMSARDYVKNGPVDQNLIKVSLIYKFENIDKVIYNFVYQEDLSLVSLEVTSGEE